jgi:tetratricopeptide (TPR) repeat protein
MFFRVVVLAACACILSSSQTPLSTIQESLALFNSGNYQRSFELALSYSVQHPESAAAFKLLGMAQFMLGKPDEALKALQHAIQLAPRDPDAYYYLGRLYFSKDNAVEALAAFQKALELEPTSVRAMNHLGQTYEALARFDDAEKAYLAAIAAEQQQAKKSEWPSYNLGLLYLNKGKGNEAIPYLRLALERNPQFAAAKMKLGTALANQGYSAEALDLLNQTVELEPENAEAHYRLGQLLNRLGKHKEAEQHLALFNRLRKR